MDRLRLLAFLLLVTPAPTLATPAHDLEEGLRLYQQLEYSAAVPRLESALAAESLPASDRARAALTLSVLQLALGEGDARESMAAALRLDPQLVIPEGSSPKVRSLFEEVRESLATEAPVPAPVPAPTPEATPPEAEGDPAAAARAEPDAPRAGDEAVAPFYSEWWFWGAIGAGVVIIAAAGAGLGTYFTLFHCDAPQDQGCVRVKVQR